jgi:uncharacterized membrane protein
MTASILGTTAIMAESSPSPARLEAFSDGVIAVIITVMVLEIKVPHPDGMKGLRLLAPAVLIYLLSFAFTGIYWLNHQHLIERVERAGQLIQCSNLGFLFFLSLLPLSTEYVVDKEFSGFAVAVYATSLLTIALAFMWLRLVVHAHLNLQHDLNEEDRKGMQSHLFSIAFYAASIILARFYPRTVLSAIALLTLVWAIPNLSLGMLRRQV